MLGKCMDSPSEGICIGTTVELEDNIMIAHVLVTNKGAQYL